MEYSYYELFYIGAVSFQLSGALMLVKYMATKGKLENIIKSLINETRSLDYGEEVECGKSFDLSKEAVRRQAREIYSNIIAATYIMVGYLLSIFGDFDTGQRPFACLLVLIVSWLLITLGKRSTVHIVRKRFLADYKVIVKNDGNLIIEEIGDTVGK